MKLVNSIVSWVFKRRIGHIEHALNHPIQTQNNVFKHLIEEAKTTAFGIDHKFETIHTLEEFKRNVPIHTYETLFPFIEKIMKGEQNVLWPTSIKWFAKSSGTTSGVSKFIPVSNETLEQCHFEGAKDAMALYCINNEDSQVFSGKSLIMGGSHQINELNEQSKYGDVSAVMMQNMPLLGHYVQTPGLKIALLEEWEEKLEKMANITIHQNITSISGVPTWTLVLLKKVLEKTGKTSISDVWPNLELYIHGGVNFEPYREQFEQLIPNPKMRYYQMYNASEGFFAMQDNNTARDMILMLDYGIFYEFIPQEEFGKQQPNTIQLNEVELGKQYAIVISTNSGLWRYQIGDTIEFTNLSPFRIKVTGRTKSFINAFGEEVIVEDADYAIQEACAQTNAILKEYTAAPIYFKGEEKGGHEWVVEFEQEPNDFDTFKAVLDQSLQATNTDYKAKRHKNLALIAPTIHKAQPGTFNQWLKQKGKLGGQNKVPRLANNRGILTEILSILDQQ